MEYLYDRSRYFEMPKYFYFEAKNSTVMSKNTFNFRIVPDEDKLKASVWYGLLCSELSEMKAESEFIHSFDGYKELIYWIDEQYDSYAEELKAGRVEGKRTYEEKE